MLHFTALLAFALALVAPIGLHAQPATNGPLIAAARLNGDRLELRARCPDGAPLDTAALSLDGISLAPVQARPVELPLDIAIVVETSAAMDGPGTPFSTARHDAAALLAALLDRTPPDAEVSLIDVGAEARLLVAAAAPAVARAQVPPLIATNDQSPGPGSLADAVELATGQLAAAPDSQRVLVLLHTSPGLAGQQIEPEIAQLRIAFGQPAAEEFAFHADSVAAIPKLIAEAVAGYDALLAARSQTLLQASIGALTGAVHRLTVSGCGGTTLLSLSETAAGWGWPWAAVLIAAAGGAAAAILAPQIWRRWAASRRRARPAQPIADADPNTEQFRLVLDAPTERHGLGQAEVAERYTVEARSDNGQVLYELTGRQCTLGRDPACDIQVESAWVSGLHARIACVAGGLELTDLGSTNGTFLGAERRRLDADVPTPLEPGEPAWLGPDVQLQVRYAEEKAR